MTVGRVLAKIQATKRLRAHLEAKQQEREALQASESSPADEVVWAPNPGPQTEFFESDCREVLYGGAAGGGKSSALVALPLKWAGCPGFLSLTLRREGTQLLDLLAKASELYPKVVPGIRFSSPGNRAQYRTPQGAKLLFGHCKDPGDFAQYDGWEINSLGFDELTHFTREQYVKICARVRSARPGLPTIIRATTNPGGEGHAWVFRHWGAWLDPDFEAQGLPPKTGRPKGPPAKPGEIWWIRTAKDGTETYYSSDPGDEPGRPPALSRTFIPAKLSDNPRLFENDPNYVAQLHMLDAVRRAQLEDGDWLVKPAAGLYFKRSWCLVVERSDIPRDAEFCRFWDRAGTEESEGGDPDYTCGVLMARSGSMFWVVDRLKERWSPGKVETLIEQTAAMDCTTWGMGVLTVVAQDPGQAGKDQAQHTISAMQEYRVGARRETGSKLVRFGPFSSQAEHGNVRVCRGAWNEDYFQTLEAFDGAGKVHDDDADATSGAYKELLRIDPGSASTATRPSREV